MILALLLAQASLLLQPMYRAPEPPPVRSARHVLLHHAEVPNTRNARSLEDTLALAADLAQRLRAGADFAQVANEFSNGSTARTGGVMGSYAPGVLAPEIESFLWSAEVGDLSGPLRTPTGVHVVQRIETYAAVRRMLFAGNEARARCDAVLAKLRAGGDFAELAKECSDDPESAARGGAFAIYERGATDKLLKAAAFNAALSEVVGPIDTQPIGLNLLQRVPIDSIDASLRENNFARFSAILVRCEGVLTGPQYAGMPSLPHAKSIADGLRARALAGEDFAKLARERDDDTGGRERDGDLGWVHRWTPTLLEPIAKGFFLPVGGVGEPEFTPHGFLFVKRTR